MIEAGSKIKVHFYNVDNTEITTVGCYGKVFDVYEKGGRLGIDYMNDSKSAFRFMYDENGFTPLDSFSKVGVKFEEV